MKVDIKDKHILVHFEQGFGDTIMFARFLDELKEKCAKVSLVVQNGLIDLFNGSNLGVDIYTEADIEKIKFDYDSCSYTCYNFFIACKGRNISRRTKSIGFDNTTTKSIR